MDKKTRLKDNRTVRSYSNSFKIKVLGELESGRMTKREVIQHYGVGPGTLYGWIKKFARFDLYNPRVIIQMPQERDKIKSLNQEIAELKEAMIQSQLKAIRAESDMEVALEMLGVDKAHFAKKQEASRSKKQSGKRSK